MAAEPHAVPALPEGSIQPSVAEIREACSKDGASFTAAAVFCEVMADMETPLSAFLKVRRGSYSFLLESVEGAERVARYSFIGTEPDEVIRIGAGLDAEGDPMTVLEAKLAAQRLLPAKGVPLPPFRGGAVGYVSYDAVRHFEPRVAARIEAQKDPLPVPEAVFMMTSSMLVFDRARHSIKVVAHCPVPQGGASESDEAWAAAYASAGARIAELVARLAAPVPAGSGCRTRVVSPSLIAPPKATEGSLESAAAAGGSTAASAKSASMDYAAWESRSNVGREGYEGFVRSLKESIVAGDIIQAVPSQRMRHDLAPGVTAVDLYRQLRRTNPSPYMFLLELGDDGTGSAGLDSAAQGGPGGLSVVGASPEMLCKVTSDGEVETHPIAGTRRRGRTPEEDEAMARDLLGDPKERAEHIMLVDLGRNDCGRVCAPGSVKVERLMGIERYSHVMHIVSRVTGRLAEGRTALDAFRSIFPAGTVSGAPKISAIDLVASLEPERRYVYAGAVGFCTLFVSGGSAYLQAGGGIVHDSDPASEYIETINKLAASMKAVDTAVAAAT
ncbi:hypothetical protein FNF28_01038 [Cafeteria roenbergensis]|uniref:Anthranilate synthase n=1 Tax=Cafeteria roenbergensis TaxID=33653 RepID=A0A5A8DZQ7_CAFRO|nr:hypothetical protein FNF28_01038 [Cafeteria roenbergensis]